MIDMIVFIHDKLMVIFQMRVARKRRIFGEHVRPTLAAMRAIHEDYRTALEEVRQRWIAGAKPAELVVDLYARKWKKEPDREQLLMLLKVMRIWKPRFRAAFNFTSECLQYFYGLGSNSIFRSVIWQLTEPCPCLRTFEYGQGLLEYQWERICAAYAALETEVAITA